MKIHINKTAGTVLFATLFATGIICIYLGSYLALVRGENQTTRRSQTWNMAIPVAEAGIEEALAQISSTFPDVKATPGWDYRNGYNHIAKTRWITTNEYFSVVIFPPSFVHGTTTPVIVSEGFVRLPNSPKFVSRTVRVNTKLTDYMMGGMVVVTTANLNGNRLVVDSFNSTNSAFSTDGRYDVAKRRDKALLATLSSTPNSLDLGNAKVWGKVASAHNGGLPNLGAQSVVGSAAWHASGKNGLEAGAYSDDVNITVQPRLAPFTNAILPTPVGGITFLNSGDYRVDNLSGTVVVTGKARLLVTRSLNLSALTVMNSTGTASLEMYVAAADAVFPGSVNIQGSASNFKYIGVPANPSQNWAGNKTLTAGGNGQFTALMYAPDTTLTLRGGGSDVQDFSGACVVKNVNMNGHYSFHFDESLDGKMPKSFVTISWDEIRTNLETILNRNLTVKDLTALEFAAN